MQKRLLFEKIKSCGVESGVLGDAAFEGLFFFAMHLSSCGIKVRVDGRGVGTGGRVLSSLQDVGSSGMIEL